jgi:hypothetical protein
MQGTVPVFLLMNALGKEFDGKIEGINLQESAIGIWH